MPGSDNPPDPDLTDGSYLAPPDLGFDSHVRYRNGAITALAASAIVATAGQSVPLDLRLVNGALYLSGAVLLSSVGVTDKKWLFATINSGDKTVADLAPDTGHAATRSLL